MKPIFTEKPSVTKSITSDLGVTSRSDGYYEGNGYLVSWCIGYLVGLADATAYYDRYKKWRYEDPPILPAPFRYVLSEEKAAQFHAMQSLMERPDATEPVSASVAEHFTVPPRPCTEDSLLAAMENAGKEELSEDAEQHSLGAPVTKAAIIEKLVSSGSVERKGKGLIPTKACVNLVTVLSELLTFPKLTAD